MQLTLARSTLEKLLNHAASAARIVGNLDDDAHRDLVGPLAEHVDTLVHELTELLGDPHTLATPVRGPRSTFDVTPDAVPKHVEPDAPAASRTSSIAIALSGGATGGAS